MSQQANSKPATRGANLRILVMRTVKKVSPTSLVDQLRR
ncbi:MAG: hypothetical protein ACJA0V_001978, partial [Planctomycetota bacterium]